MSTVLTSWAMQWNAKIFLHDSVAISEACKSAERGEKNGELYSNNKTPKHSSTTDLELRDSERESGMPEYSACNKTMDGHDEQTFDLPSPSP